jgi:hypothetical protein
VEAPLGNVPVRKAADEVGCKLYGSNWRPLDEVLPAPVGPFNLIRGADVDAACKLAPEVERVITMIAEACEKGEITSAYRSVTGGAEILDRSVWQQPHWREFFTTGEIDLWDLPLLDEKLRPTADGRTAGRCRREVFVRREHLNRFIAALSEPNVGLCSNSVSSESQLSPHQYRYPGDAQLIERGRQMVKEGMSKLKAAEKLAVEAEGGTIQQRTERLRKLI